MVLVVLINCELNYHQSRGTNAQDLHQLSPGVKPIDLYPQCFRHLHHFLIGRQPSTRRRRRRRRRIVEK